MKYWIRTPFLILFILNSISLNSEAFVRNPDTFAPDTNNYFLSSNIKTFDKNPILDDSLNRLSPDFKITPEFKDRVSFWFDIYTRYSAQEEVIHNADYPWIVYRVVDLRPILNADGNKWVKYHASVRFSKNHSKEVREIIKRLSRMKRFDKLSLEEQEIYDQLKKIPGKNRKKIIRNAIFSVRKQVGQRDYIQKGIFSSALYMEELEKTFLDAKLPLELTRLPFVESSFNVDAVSKVGASGIWQVMPYIGRKFLIMNDSVDERNSPIKAAHAAAFILKQNKQILKSWPLALTAYNHGVGSLNIAVKKTGKVDLGYLIQHYHAKSFGFASQNFYASFLAVLHAEKYKEQIFNELSLPAPIEFKEIRLTKSLRIKKILELSSLSADEFSSYNLDIKKNVYKKNGRLPKGYVVHLPNKSVEAFLRNNNKLAQLVSTSTNQSL